MTPDNTTKDTSNNGAFYKEDIIQNYFNKDVPSERQRRNVVTQLHKRLTLDAPQLTSIFKLDKFIAN